VNEMLARVKAPGCSRVEGWERIPPPEDADYPVPEFPDSGLEEVKTLEFYERFLSPWERRYTDPGYLRAVTLGQLGSDIEFTIHSGMHLRWAAPSRVGYRPTTAITQTIQEHWDDPLYDYLGDTYSSHVNPLFWKIHGWIDERIEDWRRAHGIAGELQWAERWVGPLVQLQEISGPLGYAIMRDEWQQVDQIISRSVASGFDGFFNLEYGLAFDADAR
jgi:hypothetical protein